MVVQTVNKESSGSWEAGVGFTELHFPDFYLLNSVPRCVFEADNGHKHLK